MTDQADDTIKQFSDLANGLDNHQLGAVRIVKTDKIVVEYYIKPITTLSTDIMYRYVAPIPTVWQTYQVSFTASTLKPAEEHLKSFAYHHFQSMLFDGCPLGTSLSDYLPEKFKWILKLKEVELFECDITRKK